MNASILSRYGLAIPAPKRRTFISYQHSTDQVWYDYISSLYGDVLDLFTNRSLSEPIDSENTDYIHRAIREMNITGTSITVVLCGPETWKRKWVDWEVGSTINKGHALLGIGLPNAPILPGNVIQVPERYYRNWLTGYAAWRYGIPTPQELKTAIEDAIWRSSYYPPDNSMPFIAKNIA